MGRGVRKTWFISDTHFGHEKIISHAKRPFQSVGEMDDTMAHNWCLKVSDDDLVYHLGDIAWTNDGLKLFESLPGTKRLILGNHDDGKKVSKYVQKIELFRRFTEHGFIASHMPMMMEQAREPVNVHGHVHDISLEAPGYINISVEKTAYSPILLGELIGLVQQQTPCEQPVD